MKLVRCEMPGGRLTAVGDLLRLHPGSKTFVQGFRDEAGEYYERVWRMQTNEWYRLVDEEEDR